MLTGRNQWETLSRLGEDRRPSPNKWASGSGRLRQPPTQPARALGGVGKRRC